MNVPFVDLGRAHGLITEEINNAWKSVLASNAFINGTEVSLFEKEFALCCGKRFGVGVASGTDALTLSLIAYGIHDAEIITTAHTFVATLLAIKHSGNTPVLVDADASGNMDVALLEKKITPKTKAIMPVHVYGQPADMKKILEIADTHNLIVIEDACQAHGAAIEGKQVPVSETGCFSFYPAKNLGCLGDGGIVVTDNEQVYTLLLQLREYGSQEKYHYILEDGFNSRLDTLQAAILRVKLKKLSEWNTLRQRAAQRYRDALGNLSEVMLQPVYLERKSVYHLFTLRTKERDALREFLNERGIMTGIHYPLPLHTQKIFEYLGHREGDFPITERFCREIISLPMFPYITEEEINYVCSMIKTFYRIT